MSGPDALRGQYVPVAQNPDDDYTTSPRSSSSSSTSLRALELGEVTTEATNIQRKRSRRTNSISIFQFQDDLLPLSLTEVHSLPEASTQKTIGLYKG